MLMPRSAWRQQVEHEVKNPIPFIIVRAVDDCGMIRVRYCYLAPRFYLLWRCMDLDETNKKSGSIFRKLLRIKAAPRAVEKQ